MGNLKNILAWILLGILTNLSQAQDPQANWVLAEQGTFRARHYSIRLSLS